MNGSDRLLLALRLIAIDGPSLSMIFRDLLRYLFDEGEEIEPPTELSYRDYVLGLNTQMPVESVSYWEKTLPQLPPPPDLPVTGQSPVWSAFRRLSGKLDVAKWQGLKSKAAQYGVTANAAMLGLYAAVLRPWAQNPVFTLNVLANYRPFTHPDLAAMTGQLQQHDAGRLRCGRQLCRSRPSVSRKRWPNGSHTPASPASRCCGNFNRGPAAVAQPRHSSLPAALAVGGRFCRRAIPNVSNWSAATCEHRRCGWIIQVIENHEGLIFYWDYVSGIFEDGVPEAIFQRYQQALDQLVESSSAWDRPDPADTGVTRLAPLVDGPSPQSRDTLAALFPEAGGSHPRQYCPCSC